MNSIRIKLALIAGFTTLVLMIVLGITSYVFSKEALIDEVLKSTINDVRLLKSNIGDFERDNLLAISDLQKLILQKPTSELNSEEAFIASVGPHLRPFKEGGQFLAAFIGLPSGKMVVSDTSTPEDSLYRVYGGDSSYMASSRPWYQGAVSNNGLFVSDIYVDSETKLPCFTYAIPLIKDGKLIGILGIDLPVTNIQRQVENFSNRVFIYDNSLTIFASSDQTLLLKKDPNIPNIDSLLRANGTLVPLHYLRIEDKMDRISVCDFIESGARYTICATTSPAEISQPATEIFYINLALMVIMGIISILVLYVIMTFYLKPVKAIQDGLKNFFEYINHRTESVNLIPITSKDEFSNMGEMINKNIQITNKGLEADSLLVGEVVHIVQEAKEGRFGKTIVQESYNPQIQKIRLALNEMSEALFQMVGNDLSRAAQVFHSYENNDFTLRIQDAQGLENGVNKLGDSIAEMLRVSAGFAQELESKSKELESTIQRLLQGSNTQASSL
ncbi:hypothetical protein CCZ01_03275, partial [Helicobacter monodelphidis]|uniref:methyl-accepting chemotaxis protein n=1 Tax=Helicobacter sp. 15-1451 TaxID=2004995 RepID=UPI000DCF137E